MYNSTSGGYKGPHKMMLGSSPPPVTITKVFDAWSKSGSHACPSAHTDDEMIENENQSLRDRVADLEKKVHEQTDEIMCLRSTLADVLRRINTIEGARVVNSHSGGRATPTKEGVRLRHHHSDSARDVSKRASSYVPGRSPSATQIR
ncbi:echinoderm microtubule-associated protein-like 1 isoform X4 [Penaeus indicus]|uniref:echinoderm microtubule-associated protein-like 1 isoform X4 n=1 Tax=Penaeus indicus TaxID=29960 RepID=UPI00300CFC12